MNTEKLVKLKKIVSVLLISNTTFCLGADVATATCAYKGMLGLTIAFFIVAVLNSVAVALLNSLHDAMIEELDERTPKNNVVALFPARSLYENREEKE